MVVSNINSIWIINKPAKIQKKHLPKFEYFPLERKGINRCLQTQKIFFGKYFCLSILTHKEFNSDRILQTSFANIA